MIESFASENQSALIFNVKFSYYLFALSSIHTEWIICIECIRVFQLNNLIQQPVFSTGSLSEIALQLDAMELEVMAANNEGGIQ